MIEAAVAFFRLTVAKLLNSKQEISMRLLLYALLGIGLIIPNIVLARPVSYPTGWTAMLMNDSDKSSVHIHYSPSSMLSVGYRYEYWRQQEVSLNAMQVNTLFRRWNQEDSQANLYFKSAIGFANGDNDTGVRQDDLGVAGFVGVAVDWEDRRYFMGYENRLTRAGSTTTFYEQAARVGWAPYEGDYGDLHTWFFLEFKYKSEAQEKFKVMPMVRLFKDVHMLELGANDRGDILLNYIYRY